MEKFVYGIFPHILSKKSYRDMIKEYIVLIGANGAL
jgi:hypothetical protein